MSWEFEEWWDGLSEAEQISIDALVGLLIDFGPQLRHPHSSGTRGSNAPAHAGATDPASRTAVPRPRRIRPTSIGNPPDRMRPLVRSLRADRLYDEHLAEIESDAS